MTGATKELECAQNPEKDQLGAEGRKGVHEKGKNTRTQCGEEHALPALLCAWFGSQHHSLGQPCPFLTILQGQGTYLSH